MGVVRTFEDDDLSLEYSLLVLVDPSVAWPHEDPHIPHYRDRGDTPNGTFAGSGAGWIYADAPDLDDHRIRLELHDSEPPPADRGHFDDVLETPYRSSSGAISLAWVTSGPGDREDLELGAAEWFRVRIARRREDAEGPPEFRYHWLLQFWPDSAIEPPVWLARSEAVRDARLAEDIEAILRWTPRLPLETTTRELARRLLVSEAEVRDALGVARLADLLHTEGEEPLRLRLGPRASS
ncbi:hypothetical protein DMB66_02295 [Actinoplanes sp. ATCC 53533]|uniref:hypothetical protein n=1 Tax=Actinoplanes sp. ATCC 53533 TaxID=1288362 RepID=UPI000F7AEF17|nr:hypothetical protein [Actinoplanes sp. ATCC 53533]RSM74259.1 hypothetical protein DMB66_02295 [Actinoplanes sp. ATCC 53533]